MLSVTRVISQALAVRVKRPTKFDGWVLDKRLVIWNPYASEKHLDEPVKSALLARANLGILELSSRSMWMSCSTS